LDRRLGGLQSQSGRCGEEENCQPLLGLEPLIIQPVAQCCTTELPQFLQKQIRSNFFVVNEISKI
jgi:hypothetical protein